MEKANKILEKFNIAEVLAILIVATTGFGILWSEMHRIESKIDQQAARTDRLYEMFIDLLKEKK